VVIGFITTGLLFPRFLSTDENGLLKLLVAWSTIFGQFATLGVNNVTVRLFPYFRDKEKKHHGYLTFIFLVSFIGFLAFLGLFFFMEPWIAGPDQSKSALFSQYLYFIVPITFFTLLFNNLDAYFRSLYKAVSGSFLKEVVQRFIILIAISLFTVDLINFPQFVILYSVALCMPSVIMMALIVISGEFLITTRIRLTAVISKNEVFKVAIYGMITGFSYLAIINIDSIMINQIVGTSLTGIYAITSYFGTLVSIPSRGFIRIGASVIATSFKEQDMKTIDDIYHRSCLSQFIIGVLILLGIWLNISNVFHILPETYLPGKYVILFIGISNLIVMVGGANTIIISNSPFYKFNAYATLFLVVLTVLFNWIFIPMYGIAGAAFASVLAMLLFNITKFLIIYLNLGLQPYNLKFVYVLIIGILTYLLVRFLPELSNFYLNIVWISGITTVIFMAPVLIFKISPDINELYNKILKVVFPK